MKTSFFQLRLLAKVKPYLPPKDFERVIHLFIMSRLHYCNSLYFGVDQCLLRRLQLVQNAAARLLTGKRRYDHITPVLASLHWLPVVFRIKFKILLFTFKSLHGLAPKYMSELVCIHAPSREIRSAQQMLLETKNRRRQSRRCGRSYSLEQSPPESEICPVYRPVQNATKDSPFYIGF